MNTEYKIGDKVHYDPGYKKPENGIVKSLSSGSAFVVYNCDDDWDNYQEYTGSRTYFEHLKPGWVNSNAGSTPDR